MLESTQPQLLEREAELGELGAVFEGVLAGRGRLVVVEGAAGTGKTALAAAACRMAAEVRLRVLRARGSELEHEFPFGVMRQLLEPIVTTATARECERLLAGAAGPAEWVLAPDPTAPAERGAAGFAALNGIHWLAVNLASDQPLMLVVDDAHWADASSLRALNFLAHRISDLPIVLLAATRPVEPGAPTELLDELRVQPAVLPLTLGPLGSDSIARIVRGRLGAADDAVCRACREATVGNPLYLEELLRTIADDGLGTHPDTPALIREASVPSLGDRVVRRIASVGTDAPALSTAMAVLGEDTRLETAAKLAGIDLAHAGDLAHQLRRIEILSAEDPFAFMHPLVRRSVYDHLSERERQDAHAAAAKLLKDHGAPDAVATHLAAVPPQGSPEVAMTLVQAGQRALSQAAPDEALRWFERALQEGATEPPPPVILTQMGLIEVALRDEASIGHLQDALEQTEDPALRARITVTLAEILAMTGQWEAAARMVDLAEDTAPRAGPEHEIEAAAIKSVLTAYDPERIDEFERERPRFRRLAEGDGWAAHALAALLACAAALRGEPVAVVLALADRALDGRLLSERGAGAWASAQVLGALITTGEYDRAEAAVELVGEASRRDGTTIGTITAITSRGWIHAMRGDLAAAEVDLLTALSMISDAEMPMIRLSALYFLQDVILERPSLDPIGELAERTTLEPVFDRTWTGGMLRQVRGRLRLAHRDRDGGIADLRAVGRTATKLRLGPQYSAWRSHLAAALAPTHRDEAAALVSEELELARATGLRQPEGTALRVAGILEDGDAGLERLRESVSVLATSEARLEHARSMVELGSALRRSQRRADARPHLEAGLDLARRCGAERLLVRARDELRAAGGRPRRIALWGCDALTASELRVARLAADSATNPQIAQELYVSLKTVETHLSHVYAKLGLSGHGSRARLSTALDAEGIAPEA